MTQVVNLTDRLTFILTNYGLSRIAEAISDPSENLNLSKIKIGSGDNYSYYTPEASQTALKGSITNGSFYIIDKSMLEDNKTVSFHAIISDEFSNFEIREVGLYETVDDVDYLFAIGTQQPMVKPSTDLGYFISLDYYLNLKSSNLADVYDQIILNPDNQTITEQDFENMMSTIVFTQGNLSTQIAANSKIIGLNRASVLYDLMKSNKENYGYITAYNNYSEVLGYVDASDVYGYWVFDYPKCSTAAKSIVDISAHGHNLSSNEAINKFTQSFYGFQSTLAFDSPNYFYLDSSMNMSLVDTTNNEDYYFTMMFVVKPKSVSSKRTLLARSNYATGTHIFEVNELANGSLEVILFADTNNYITFTSGVNVVTEAIHSIILSYDRDNHNFICFVNGKKVALSKVVTGTYAHMNTSPTTLYCYSCYPTETIWSDASSTPLTHIYNSDGSPYTGALWTLESGVLKYMGNTSFYDSAKNRQTDLMYAWNFNDGVDDHTVYTKVASITSLDVPLYNSDYSTVTDGSFRIALSGSDFVVQYKVSEGTYESCTYDSTKNLPVKTIYGWTYTASKEKIWANNNTTPTILLTNEGNLYTGTDWTLSSGVITYKSTFTASYDSSGNIVKPYLEVTSYVTDSSGNKAQLINSDVGVVGVIKAQLTEDQTRNISMLLEATMGNNPCLSFY